MVFTFVFVAGGWILSLCLHEFSHALVAYWGGDYTVKEKGYLTFNPIKYTNPVTTFLLPMILVALGGIGLPGGAVYINHELLRGPRWEAAVSLAGPLSNVISAALLAIPFLLGLVDPESQNWVWPALAFLFALEVGGVVFNLLPIPPLDGYGFVSALLPRDIRRSIDEYAGQVSWLLVIVLFMSPGAGAALWTVIGAILDLVGVPGWMAYQGFQDFRFWERR